MLLPVLATKTRPGRNVRRQRETSIENTANRQKKQHKSRLYCWIPYQSHLVPNSQARVGLASSSFFPLPPLPPSQSHPISSHHISAVRVHVKGNLET